MFAKKIKQVFTFQKFLYSCPKNNFHDMESQPTFYPKSYTKPFLITSGDCALSVNCIKGKFKQEQSYIALDKMGAVLLDFIPLKKKGDTNFQQFDAKGKKNFTLNMKSIGEILRYSPYEIQNKSFKLQFEYFANSIGEDKKLTIQKNKEEEQITFTLYTSRSGNNSSFTIHADIGDFIIMHELLKYSLPYVIGWHILSSPRVAFEEFNSSSANQMDGGF